MRINIHVKQMSARSSRRRSSKRSAGGESTQRAGGRASEGDRGSEGDRAPTGDRAPAGEVAAHRPRGRPPTIDRDSVLETAIRLLDAEGVEALTMRRLASELGVSAMAPYRHVGSKDELL